MKKQSSRTAEGMAIVRAIEAGRPPEQRIVSDPLSRMIVNPLLVALSGAFIKTGLYGAIWPGVLEFILCRERYIDDLLIEELDGGAAQVVLLGAGFDTRPYRIPGIEKVRVFEVDHPVTQREKRKRLIQHFNTLPSHVTFVPIDFNTQSLDEGLRHARYDPAQRTFFIWQGVTMYLDPAAVDATLAFIRTHSGPNSLVAFDYFLSETFAAGNRRMGWAKSIAGSLGEDFTFTIPQGQVEQFLLDRGFVDVRNTDAHDLQARYCRGENANRIVVAGAGIASARVGDAGGGDPAGAITG